jgi:hypothetical protein
MTGPNGKKISWSGPVRSVATPGPVRFWSDFFGPVFGPVRRPCLGKNKKKQENKKIRNKDGDGDKEQRHRNRWCL